MQNHGPAKAQTGIMWGSHEPAIWIDARTGHGVDDDGVPVSIKRGGGRVKPNILDLIEGALELGVRKVMLTGRVTVPKSVGARHWLFTKTPGWEPLGHRVDVPITARFKHEASGATFEVRTAEEWFGDIDLTPAQAREAWNLTEEVVQEIEPKQHLLRTPSRTGLSLWWASTPRSKTTGQLILPVQVSKDIDDDLRNVRGQHHIEHLVAGGESSKHPDCVPLMSAHLTPKIPQFTYIDGKFMYASLGRELGVGPGRRLNRPAAFELLNDHQGSYARAVYEVRFTVPEGWNHIGILGVKHENVADGWFYPNRPGAQHITWAESSEVHVARAHGWIVDPLQAIVFDSGRPMDTYLTRLNRKREDVEGRQGIPIMLRRIVVAALRSILIQSIGGLSSDGSMKTMTTDDPFTIPADVRRTRYGETFVYLARGDRSTTVNYYPHLAVQIWGRGRSKLLEAPSALGNKTAGALHIPANTLIGVNGDAIYTSQVPQWALPERFGGGDDGKVGRLRIKGHLATPRTMPESVSRRDVLKRQSEKRGPRTAWPSEEEK